MLCLHTWEVFLGKVSVFTLFLLMHTASFHKVQVAHVIKFWQYVEVKI